MEAALKRGAVAVRRVCKADAAAAQRPLRADGTTPIHMAVTKREDWFTLHVLAEAGADVDSRTAAGVTPLQVALQDHQVAASAALLALGADVQAHVADLRWTPLHVAAWEGDWKALGALARVGPDLGVADRLGWTPLHVAVLGGRSRAVELLLDRGADVAARDRDDGTPLHYAARGGHTHLVGVLVDRGADVAASDTDGETPLHLAAAAGYADVVGVLVDRWADVAAGAQSGRTPLHYAARGGHTHVVRVLVDMGADVASGDKDGETPLLNAVAAGHADVVGVLVDRGADVAASDRRGETPLGRAAIGGHADVVGVLVDGGADVAAGDKTGETPLHHAARGGHTHVVRMLVDRGADVAAGDKDGETPLLNAVAAGHADVVGVLVRKPADVAARDKNGETPLHHATRGRHADVVGVLVHKGADVAASDKNGHTPLHRAANEGHADMVEVLLKAGAAVDGAAGQSPLSVAAQLRDGDAVITVLIAWGAVVPKHLRPGGVRARLSSNAKSLRPLLENAPRMSDEERKDARAEWRAAVERRFAAVVPPTAADRALAQLQAALHDIESAPASLSLDTLYGAVTSSRILDVRCLRCAHQLLVFASRVGLFALEAAADSSRLQQHLCDRVYAPVLEQLKQGDRPVVAAIVHDAVSCGLLSDTHRSMVKMVLHLHAGLSSELQQVNRRLNHLELSMENIGRFLFMTIKELQDLQQHLQEKEEHERKVALAKSLVKLGVSLAPIVGGAINSGIDAVVDIVDIASGTAAAYKCLAVPSDIAAARQVLRCIADAKNNLGPEELERVQAFVDQLAPYKSLEAVDRDLGWAVQVLELDAEAAPVHGMDAGVAQVSEAAAGRPDVGNTDAERGALDDKWSKPKEVLVDASIEHGGDVMSERWRNQPARRPGAHPSNVPVGSSAARCRSGATAPGASPCGSTSEPADQPVHPALRPTAPADDHPSSRLATASPAFSMKDGPRYGRAFFAGLLDWDCDALVTNLVDYVVGAHPLPVRTDFAAVVRDGAAKHGIDGRVILRCRRPHVMADCLLGNWSSREGMRESVRSFIKEAKKFTC